MLSVGLVIFPRMTQLDATAPYEVFARIPGATVHLVAASMAPVVTEHGLALLPTTTFRACPELDIVCVPGGPGIDSLLVPEPLDFLADRGARARYVTSVCTGALVLGAAGLLQGYRATTHWLSLDLLRLVGAEPVEERVVVDRNRITAGGVTAGIDFALRIAAAVDSPEVAAGIQLLIEYDPAPPFDSGSPRTAAPELVAGLRESRAALQARRAQLLTAAVATRAPSGR